MNGTSGSNGWLKAATLNAGVSDPTPGSRLAALEYALDGGAWTGFDGHLTIPDGVHTLTVRAGDLAGLLSQSEPFNVKVDSLAPAPAVTESGTMGANGWYITPPTVAASVQETGSGLALLETSLDNGAWTSYTGPLTLTKGVHTLSFWAEDAAGWVTQETRTLQVDTRLPLLGGSLSGMAGRDPLTGQVTGWYISPVTLTATASDPAPGSGLASLTYRLNGGAETPYTSPLTLTEGENLLTLTALDLAGLPKTLPQTIRVDTLPPALQISTSLPTWVKDTVTLHGSAADPSAGSGQVPSGLKRVEISFDNGNTWQTAPGAASWQIDWDTRNGINGRLNLLLRAVDAAGLSTTLTLPAQVDNRAPRIALPAGWNIWDTVTFDAHDAESGLEGAELVISDPQNRWPRRVYTFAPGHLPVDFTWDRRFADGTLAPMGDYHVKATATDRMGNTRVVNATLHISLTGAILPPPAVSTPLGTPRPTAAPASTVSTDLTGLPSFTPTTGIPAIESQTDFGETASGVILTPAPTATLIPRATPTTGSFGSWVASVFNPQPTPTTVTTQTVSKAPAASPIPTSAILWGAASAAAVGFFVAEAQKRKEEEERREREAAEAQQNALAQMFLNDKKPESEPKTTLRKKKKPLTPRERLQAIWDRNGAMIYEINQAFKARFGRDMDAAARKKAIKDATKNGVFQAGKYAGNLSAAKRRQEARNRAIAAKLARMEAEEGQRTQRPTVPPKSIVPASGTHNFARKPKSAKPGLRAGLQALYEGRKAGEVTVVTPPKVEKKPWWENLLDVGKGLLGSALPLVGNPAGGGGKLAAPAKPPEPPTWLQNLIDKGKKVVEIGKKIVTATIEKGKELVETGKDFVENIWEDAKQLANDHFVQPIKDAYTWAENYADSLPPSLKDKIYAIGRDVAIHTIPPVAEFIYDNVTVPIVSFAQDHPYITEKTTNAINSVLDHAVRPTLNHVVDTNPDTMSWVDLGMTWLFELGDKSEFVFGPGSNLTQDIMKHDVVQEVRTAAIEKIADGRLEDVLADCLPSDSPVQLGQYPVCKSSKFGVTKYFQSLGEAVRGDLSKEYLGSYTVTIYVEQQGDGWYVFHYEVKNSSTWESATRLRVDSLTDNDTINEGIIPDTSNRGVGITLGGKLDQTFEWTEKVYIPEREK